jgi:hypothetical protein
LESCKLRGVVDVDPRKQDFFRVVIEERRRLSKRSDISELEHTRLDKALKVLANAASYGIYAEMHRKESDRKQTVTCHGIDLSRYINVLNGAAYLDCRSLCHSLEHRVILTGQGTGHEPTTRLVVHRERVIS